MFRTGLHLVLSRRFLFVATTPTGSGVVHYDLDLPYFAGNADAHQNAPEGAPCEEGETAEQCIQWDYVAHLYTSQQTFQPIPSLMEPLGSVIGASSASRCSTSTDWR